MEGSFSSHIFSIPRRIASYFYVFYIEHFSHIPHGDIWDTAYGYAEEVGNILHALARRSHANVLLVGQKGVGSLGVAKEVAVRVHANNAHANLRGHRVFFISIEELLRGIPSGIDQVHALARVVSEMEQTGKCIAVLTHMDGVFAGNYTLRPEDVLYPFFASPYVRTITILSDEEYAEHVAPLKSLSHLVEKMQIAGLDVNNTRELLKSTHADSLHPIIDEVVVQTEHIFPNIPYPKRAIDILQELIAENTLHPHHVAKHISKKMGIDMQRLKETHMVQIEEAIHRNVVNQKQAVEEIKNALIRSRSKPSNTKHPIASMLFVGPKGVGKRETAKALALSYFGSSKYLVQLDVQKNAADLPMVITEHPFCILFLEHFGEASPEVHEVILSAITNGYVTDAFGRKYFTTHMVIIATSNGVSEDACSTELLESFDGVITFTPLAKKHVQEIARKMLARLNGRLQIEYDVSLQITQELIDYLVQEGYSDELGAHTMQQVMQKTVERLAMQAITKGSVVPGGKILIDPKQFA